MDTSKVSLGEMIAGASALALFIFMFLPWYGVDGLGGFVSANANAWEAFSLIDLLLLLAVVVVAGLVIARAADALPELPQPPATIIAGAGAVALLLVFFRLVFPPVDDVGREIGLFLGLLASAGIAYGGWRAMNEAVPPGGGVARGAGPGDGSSTGAPPPPSSGPGAGTPGGAPPATGPGGGQGQP